MDRPDLEERVYRLSEQIARLDERLKRIEQLRGMIMTFIVTASAALAAWVVELWRRS